MIVKLTAFGPVTVPVILSKEETAGIAKPGSEKQLLLLPGYNEENDEMWMKARQYVLDSIKSGKFEEYSKDEKDEAGNIVPRPISFRQVRADKARDMVKNCYCIETLDRWLDGYNGTEPETREELRLYIREQKEMILAGGPTKVREKKV